MKDHLELHFCAERPPRLLRTVLRQGEYLTSAQDVGVAAPGEAAFPNSRGLQVLCLALVRLHLLEPEGERRALLTGMRGSAASTLDSLVHKAQAVSWLEDMLRTPAKNERLRLHAWFKRRNSQHNNGDKPVEIFAGQETGSLAPRDVKIFSGGRRATLNEAWEIERALARALGEPMVAGARVHGGLPATDEGLVGREGEAMELHDALANGMKRGVQIVAPGGTGKTALAARCVRDLAAEGGGPFTRIFAWSFYRQGLAAEAALPMWQFRAAAAEALGASLPDAASPQEIADALLAALRREPTLLVLDGVESVLHPAGEEMGRLRDDVLPGLLAGLAGETGGGAFLLTTRVPVADLEATAAVATMHLAPLRREHTRALLRELGVKGLPRDLDEAAAFAEGRPLLVRLLASRYRAEPRDPHTGLRGLLTELRDATRWADGWSDEPAMARMLRSYARWFAGRPELVLLQLAALFDRLPDEAAMRALLVEPGRVGGLLEDWRDLPAAQWEKAAESLRGHGLAVPGGKGLALEMHPVVHGFFAAGLRAEHPEAWRAGHLALYEFFRALPDKEQPDTLEELEPLLRACYHGARAGAYRRAFEEVGLPRISRGIDAYLFTQLGAIHETRALMEVFLDGKRGFPADSDLTAEAKGLVFSMVAHCERIQDRLDRGIFFMVRAIRWLRRGSDPLMFALCCVNAIRMCVSAGRLRRGLWLAVRLSLLAKRHPALFSKEPINEVEEDGANYCVGILLGLLLASGRRADGEKLLEPILERLRRKVPDLLLLPGLPAPSHAQWLLETGRTKELVRAIDRGQAECGVRRFEFNNGSALIKGRAWLHQALDAKAATEDAVVGRARVALDEAMHQARNFGRWLLVAEALLPRARWHSHFGREEDYERDRNQAQELCRTYGFRLLEADLCLLDADHQMRRGRISPARVALRLGEKIVRQCRYQLRKAEVARLRRGMQGRADTARGA